MLPAPSIHTAGTQPRPDGKAGDPPRTPWLPSHDIALRHRTDDDDARRWPFDPLLPVDVTLQTIDGRPKGLTRHSYCEVIYISSGRATVTVEEQTFEAGPGTVVVIAPDLPHELRRVGDESDEPAKVCALFFERAAVEADTTHPDEAGYLRPFTELVQGHVPVIPAQSPLAARIYHEMLEILRMRPSVLATRAYTPTTAEADPQHALATADARIRLGTKTHLRMVLWYLLEHFSGLGALREQGPGAARDVVERIRPVLQHIARHPASPHSVASMARLVHMSPSTFARHFRAATGQSFGQYVLLARLANARRLLHETDKPVGEVSFEVGFSSQSHFGWIFRRHSAGLTPLEYRRKSRVAAQTALKNA